MLRTALGSSIAAWLDDPAVIEVMLNPDGRLWVDRLAEGIGGHRRAAVAGGRRTHRPPGRTPCRRRGSCRAPRASRPSCRKAANASKACCRPWSPHRPLPSASPRSRCSHSTTIPRPGSCRRLRPRRCARRSRTARNILVAGGTGDRQDHAGQCAAGRGRQDRRPRRPDRGHARTAMRRAEPRRHADQGRRGLAVRSRALLAAAAP